MVFILRKKKKTHVDDYVVRKYYFDKYFGGDTILTIFFFQSIIFAFNSCLSAWERRQRSPRATATSLELFDDPLLKTEVQDPVEWILGANEAILNKATGFQGNYSSGLSSSPIGLSILGDGAVGLTMADCPLGSPSGFRPLQLLLQDGRLLDLMGNDEMGSLGKQVVGRVEEMEWEEVNKALEEITALLKKMKTRKGHGVKVLRGSRKSGEGNLEA